MPFRNIPIRSMLGVPSFTAHYETQKGEGVLFVEDQWLRSRIIGNSKNEWKNKKYEGF